MLTVDAEVTVLGETKDLLRCDLCGHEDTRPAHDEQLLEEDRRRVLADGGQLKLGQSQARLGDALQEDGDDDPVDVDDQEEAEDQPPTPDQIEGLITHEYGPDADPHGCVAGYDDCAGARSLRWGHMCCIACWVLADDSRRQAYEEAVGVARPMARRYRCRSCGELSADVYRCSECGVDFATDESSHGRRGSR